jgi:hypothetical protein
LSNQLPTIAQQPESTQPSEICETDMPDFDLPEDTHQNPAALRIEDLGWPTASWSHSDLLHSSAGDLTLGAFSEMLEQPSQMRTPSRASANYSQLQSPAIRHTSKDKQHSLPLASQSNFVQDVDEGLTVIHGRIYRNVLSPRKSTTTQSFLTTQVLWGQLKAYPKKMIQGQLPPFIYPSCVLDDVLPRNCAVNGVHRCLSGPLAVCASLVSMFYSRTPTSSSFVWKTIYTEVKRLKSEVILETI